MRGARTGSLPATGSNCTSGKSRTAIAARAQRTCLVDNSDAVAAEWRDAGGEVHGPQDSAWGQHEGALVDPDGNVIRFGSPISGTLVRHTDQR